MTNRLSRIIDRAPVLEQEREGLSTTVVASRRVDLCALSRRAKLISVAITLCTTTALLVCTVIP